jgi:uncharacterized protein YbaR (Trm112 family)
MTRAVSVVCPACSATLKVTKTSLIGRSVACPSCKKPFRIEAPAVLDEKKISIQDTRFTDAPLPLQDDDIPLKDDSMPLVGAQSPVQDDWIPLQDSEPATHSRRAPASSDSMRTADSTTRKTAAIATKKSSNPSSRDDQSIRKDDGGRERSSKTGPKSGSFASQAQKTEFELMLVDTEGDGEVDFASPVPRRRKQKSGSKSSDSALKETEEFNLLETDEHPSLPVIKRATTAGRKKDRAGQTTHESESGTIALHSDAEGQRDPDMPVRPRKKKKKQAETRRKQLIIGICLLGAAGAVFVMNKGTAPSVPAGFSNAGAVSTPSSVKETPAGSPTEAKNADDPPRNAGRKGL